MDFDLVIKNGTVVTASDIWNSCDIGIKVSITTPSFIILHKQKV